MSEQLTPPPIENFTGENYEIHLEDKGKIFSTQGTRLQSCIINNGHVTITMQDGAIHEFEMGDYKVSYSGEEDKDALEFVFKSEKTALPKFTIKTSEKQMSSAEWKEFELRLGAKRAYAALSDIASALS